MNKTVDSLFNLYERSERNDSYNFSVNNIALSVFLCRKIPRLRLKLFVANRNLFVFAVDFKNFELITLTDFKNIRHFFHARPRKIGDVRKTIKAVYGNKCSKRGHALHLSFDGCADFDRIKECLFLFRSLSIFRRLFLFKNHALRSNDFFSAFLSDFKKAQTQLLALIFLKIVHIARTDFLRRNENGIGSEFCGKSALVEPRTNNAEFFSRLNVA